MIDKRIRLVVEEDGRAGCAMWADVKRSACSPCLMRSRIKPAGPKTGGANASTGRPEAPISASVAALKLPAE